MANNKSKHGKRYDWSQAPSLYNAGNNDHAMARFIGCTSGAVRSWRLKRGLPVQPEVASRPKGSISQRLRSLMTRRQKLTNNQLAELCACRVEYIRTFKQREAKRIAG